MLFKIQVEKCRCKEHVVQNGTKTMILNKDIYINITNNVGYKSSEFRDGRIRNDVITHQRDARGNASFIQSSRLLIPSVYIERERMRGRRGEMVSRAKRRRRWGLDLVSQLSKDWHHRAPRAGAVIHTRFILGRKCSTMIARSDFE